MDIKKRASKRFALPEEQIRYYSELTEHQIDLCDRWFGILPPRDNYMYAAKRDGGLVWDRVRIVELERG